MNQSTHSSAWVTAWVGLGANLGDPARSLKLALETLAKVPGVRVEETSSFYRTEPIDSSGPDYVNAVTKLATCLKPSELLGALQTIENTQGRLRPYRNAPRTLDLDVLLYANLRIDTPALTIPHPRMWQRAFVVVPLAEIAPALVDAHRLAAIADQRIERLPNSLEEPT